MPQSLTNLLYHLVFSTKGRHPQIDADLAPKLHAYLAGICAELGGKPIRINGAADHVHVLTYLPPTVALSNEMRDLKSNSSKWVHASFAGRAAFAWQAGYGAFSVSRSNLEVVKGYIAGQEERHRTMSFQDEFREFLRRHGVAWDERYVWD